MGLPEVEFREDEIEAILKFDGSKLLVSDDWAQTGLYRATITGRNRAFTRESETRISAVHKVWQLYLQFTSELPESVNNGYWLYENALGDVEIQLMKNREKQSADQNGNGK